MNEKERIIELVRQNVISMEEALTLLEAAGKKDMQLDGAETQAENTNVVKSQADFKAGVEVQADSEEVGPNPTEAIQAADTSTSKQKEEMNQFIETVVEKGFDLTHKLADFIGKTTDDKTAKSESAEVTVSDEAEATDKYAKEYQEAAEAEASRLSEAFDGETPRVRDEDSAARFDKDIEAIEAQISTIKEELTTLRDQHTITKQRLRELEIFSELDDLTSEMLDQQSSLTTDNIKETARLDELAATLRKLQDRRTRIQAERMRQLGKDSKEFIKNRANDLGRTTQKIAEEAVRQGSRYSKVVKDSVMELAKNFDMKDISIGVPWIKLNELNHTFELPGADVEDIAIKVTNGSVDVEVIDGDSIIIEAELRFHGNFDAYTAEAFAALSKIESKEHTFRFTVTHPKLSIDAVVKVPKKYYHAVKVDLYNGDSLIRGIQVQDFIVSNKNGELSLEDIQADRITVTNFSGDFHFNQGEQAAEKVMEALKVDLYNGDADFTGVKAKSVAINDKSGEISLQVFEADTIAVTNFAGDMLFEQIQAKDIVAKTYSGDIRIEGPVANFTGETTSGDIYVTKRDGQASQLELKTLSGDIKVAQNAGLNLAIEAQTSSGAIEHRLSHIHSSKVSANQRSVIFERNRNAQANKVTINAEAYSGDIRLKDNAE